MLNEFFENSLSGFLITDERGDILRVNATLANWISVSPETLQGRRIIDIFSIGSKMYYETHLSPLLKMQGFFGEVLMELSGPGNIRTRVLVNAAAHNQPGTGTGSTFYTLVTATDRLRYEKTLKDAREVAESALLDEQQTVALREQLIAVLGHDLRNPLNAITMAASLLEDGIRNETDKIMIDTVVRSTRRMTELISNIMDFAKTRLGGGLVIETKTVLLQLLIELVVKELQMVFSGREVMIRIETPLTITCDPHRIAQLLSNLVANALIHGAKNAPVHIDAFKKNDVLDLSVCNSGSPIPNDMIAGIFEPFTRESKRSSNQGLGLGLYISAEIARAHNGTLTCTSDSHETCFRLQMPA